MCSVLTGVLCNSFLLSFSSMQCLLSGDFEALLCESLDASSVEEERGQESGVEGEGRDTPLPHHPYHPTHPHTSPTPSSPSLYCTLQGTVDSTVLSDGGKGENSDPESEAVVTSTDAIN